MGARTGRVCGAVAGLGLLTGCTGGTEDPTAQTVTATVTETVTVTETATVTVPVTAEPPGEVEETTAGGAAERAEFEITVLEDGCAVARTEGDADGLTWSVVDDLGVQVLGRNALGETAYRYFQAGTYTVVLEAWAGDRYAPVSNVVTITC